MGGLNIGDVFMRVLADMTGFETDVTKKATAAGEKAGIPMGQRMGKAVTAGLTAAGAAAGTIFVGAVGGATNFEAQLRTINTVAHLTDTELQGVGNSILDLSKETGKSTDDLTAGFYDLVSAGVPADKAINVLKNSAILATGALGTTGEAVDLLTSAMGAFGIDASESSRVMDVFAQTVADGKTTVSELAGGISQVAPIAAGAGVSLEEVAAATGIMTLKGDTASQAMTRIKNAISALLTPNAELLDIQKRTGISFADLAKQKGLLVALEELRKATNGDQESFAKALGSSEALTLAFATTGENAAAAATELAKVQDAAEKGGVAQSQYEEIQKSAAFQGKKFVAGIRATAIQLAGPFVDSLGGAVVALNELGGGMGGLVNLSRLFGGALGGVAGFVASKFGPLVKRGLAAALGRIVIPASVFAGPLEAGLESGVSSLAGSARLGGATDKIGKLLGGRFGLAFKLAAVVGIAALADEIAPQLFDLGADLNKAIFGEGDNPLRAFGRAVSDFNRDAPWPLGMKGAPDWARIGDDTRQGLDDAVGTPVRDAAGDLHAQTDGIGKGVEASLGKQRDDVARGAQTMMSGVKDAAGTSAAAGASLGASVAVGAAQGLYDTAIAKQSVVQNAFKLLLSASADTMHKVDEINYLVGVLMSKELARGLTDTRESVRVAAQETQAAAIARLNELRPNAGNIGKKTNEELAKGLKSKDPVVREAARKTKQALQDALKGAKAKPAGAGAGQAYAEGVRTKGTAVYNAGVVLAGKLAKGLFAGLIHSVAFSKAHSSNPKAGGGLVEPGGRMASGGTPVVPFAYQINEKGQELFVPAVRGRVMTAADTRAILSARETPSGATNIVNLETYGLPMRAETPSEVARAIRRIQTGVLAPRRRLGWT